MHNYSCFVAYISIFSPINDPLFSELEITVGHRTFSEQNGPMSGHFRFWLDMMSKHYFWFLLILRFFHVFV